MKEKEGQIEDPEIAMAMASEENKGRNQKARGTLGRGFAKIKEKVFGNEELTVAQGKSEEVKERLEVQKKLVEEFKAMLERTRAERFEEDRRQPEHRGNIESSPHVSVFDDHGGYGKEIRVSYWHIVPQKYRKSSTILEVHIDLSEPQKAGWEIHIMWDDHRKDASFSLNDVEKAKAKARELLENYSLN